MKHPISRKVFFIIVGFLFAVLYVTTRVQVVEVGYEVIRAQEKVQELKQAQGLLKTRIATANATFRLDLLTKRLEMEPPNEDNILFMDKKK